jgi:hypothetical protein
MEKVIEVACYPMRGGGIICGDLGPHCTQCGGVSDILCDFPVGYDKTCDRALCKACAHRIAPDTDYCLDHFSQWEAFEAAGGVKKMLENVVPYRKKYRSKFHRP